MEVPECSPKSFFIQGCGLHVRESAQDEGFVFALPSQPYVPIKGKGKSSSFWKTTQNLPKSNQQNRVSLWVGSAGELEHLPCFKLKRFLTQLSAEFISEFPSFHCVPGFGETEVMKWGSVLAILGKIILVWIYSPQNRHLKMGAWAMSCCSSSEWNLLLVHPVSCSLFFCMEWKTLSLFWEVPWCS